MQMIDVLKRLAELDESNPRVETTQIAQEQSLATLTNLSGQTKKINESTVAECGPMGMIGGMDRPSTPASFSINASAESGDEVAGMLSQILNLAGVKEVGPQDINPHTEIELEPAHDVQVDKGGDDMASLIGLVDKINGPADGGDDTPDVGDMADEVRGMADEMGGSPDVGDMADEVRDMTDELKDEGVGAGFDTATTTPDEKTQSHDYGNKDVTPKPQGLKQRQGDNPYTQVESVALQLLKDYQNFINEQK
jgi:hypothetical protein